MATAEIKRHWNAVAEVGCLISRAPNPTMHHCHSGSMTAVMGLAGWALKSDDWLVIPLAAHFHYGNQGIDGCLGVISWEDRYETQVNLLDELCRIMNINLWHKAGINREVPNGYAGI